MKLSGGDLLMRALKDEGVKFIFGYPGGAALHIYDAIFKQKIKISNLKSFTVKGYLNFMVCDESKCLPPEDVDFEFKINAAAKLCSILQTSGASYYFYSI